MSEQLRAALDDAIYDAAVLRTESVRLTASDARRIRAALAAAPSTPEPGIDVERLRTWVGEHAVRQGRLPDGATVVDAEELDAYLARLASKDRTPSAD